MDGIRITRFRVFKNVRFVGGKIRFHLNMNRPYDDIIDKIFFFSVFEQLYSIKR